MVRYSLLEKTLVFSVHQAVVSVAAVGLFLLPLAHEKSAEGVGGGGVVQGIRGFHVLL